MNWHDLLFGKKDNPAMSLDELETYTVQQEKEYDSKTRILKAKTNYDKAKVEHAKLMASNPKVSSGGILTKKWIWLIGGAVFALLLIIKAVT